MQPDPATQTLPKNNKILAATGMVLFVLIVFGVIILLSLNNDKQTSPDPNMYVPTSSSSQAAQGQTTNGTDGIVWSQTNDGGWVAVGDVPDCPSPLLINAPSSLVSATALLYPGQVRGGNYKPHGGIAYDNNATNSVTVTLPMDARLFRGARYIESGELQYLLDFITPCGVMFRYDHLKVLAPDFEDLVDAQLPQPQIDDTRTTMFNDYPSFAADTVVAIEVGHTNNVAYDWGVYDLRQTNQASLNPNWAATYSNVKETAHYAICWIELLPQAEREIAQSLPARGTEGKTSDYCQF